MDTLCIKWLEDLLFERFKVSINIACPRPDLWELSVSSSSERLFLPRLESCFAIGKSDIPCALWSSKQINLAHRNNRPMPAPGISVAEQSIFSESNGKYFFNYDVLSLAWWCLSRAEEVNRAELDQFGRFSSGLSHAAQYNYLDRPIVDEWFELLREAFKEVWPKSEFIRSSFSLSISHDIDRPSRFAFSSWPRIAKRSLADAYRTRSLKALLTGTIVALKSKSRIHEDDPYNTFDWLMSHSERLGVKSTFYFLAGVTNIQHDADYQLDDPRIRKIIKEIGHRGHKIGLHPSFDTYVSPQALEKEIKTIRSVTAGENIDISPLESRMHYLRFSVPQTFVNLSNLGVMRDSTLGYADKPGFRCGTCHPYQAINAITGEVLPIRIEPLIAMDVSFYRHNCTMPEFEKNIDCIMSLRTECSAVGGVFSLLWHNSELWSQGSRDFYQKITQS